MRVIPFTRIKNRGTFELEGIKKNVKAKGMFTFKVIKDGNRGKGVLMNGNCLYWG